MCAVYNFLAVQFRDLPSISGPTNFYEEGGRRRYLGESSDVIKEELSQVAPIWWGKVVVYGFFLQGHLQLLSFLEHIQLQE